MSLEIDSKSGVGQNDTVSTDDEVEVPKWLDATFLEKHLQEYYNDQHITVVDFEINAGAGKRENIASSLFRMNVKFIKNEPDTLLSKEKQVNGKYSC